MCISIQKNSFSVKQQLCLYCKRNQTNTCFRGRCYQRNYRQHTKVRSVGSNSLSHETCKLMYRLCKLTCETIFIIDTQSYYIDLNMLLCISTRFRMYLRNNKKDPRFKIGVLSSQWLMKHSVCIRVAKSER